MPPPRVPIYCSHFADIFDKIFLSSGTLWRNAVASVAELTNALELDKPEAGGILPLIAAHIPYFCSSFCKYSYIPLMPQRK